MAADHPAGFGDAYSIFLLRQFLLTIPREYLDAARVDGCGEWRTLLRVVCRWSSRRIAAVAPVPVLLLLERLLRPADLRQREPGAWTLSYGLESFKGAHHVNWNLTMAATLLVMAPVIILFFFAQRAFIQGVTLTGVKG